MCRSPVSIVSVVARWCVGKQKSPLSVLGRREDFSLLQSPYLLLDPISLLFSGYRGPFPGAKSAGAINQPLTSSAEVGRAMARAVNRRSLTAEAQVRSLVSPCGICGGQSGNGTDFSPSTSVFPCQLYSISTPLIGKAEKNFVFITGLHNKPSRLRCDRSICCGARQ